MQNQEIASYGESTFLLLPVSLKQEARLYPIPGCLVWSELDVVPAVDPLRSNLSAVCQARTISLLEPPLAMEQD